MEFFRIKKDIPFMKHALIFNAISFLTFIAAVVFIAVRGLHFSIEFTGMRTPSRLSQRDSAQTSVFHRSAIGAMAPLVSP